MFRLQLLLPFLFGLSACGGAYVAPASGPVAEIAFASDKDVAVFMFKDSYDCSGRRGLGAVVPSKKTVSTKISAGKEFAVWLHSSHSSDYAPGGMRTVNYCEVMVSFVPRADASYVADFSYSGSSCFVIISDVQRDERGNIVRKVLVPVTKRVRAGGMTNDGPWCKALGSG